MIDYGQQDHGGFVRGLGDWSDKIKSGTISAGAAGPEARGCSGRPASEICRLMGYL